MSLLDTASLVVTPNGTKASKLYSVVPSSGAGDLDVTRATTATRVNSSGLIESVASNVPRLDYTNGTCPSILVEPQRTNLLAYSEQFDNASYWSIYLSTVTANTTISPDGTNTADTLTAGAPTGGDVYRLITLNGTYSASVFFKAGTSNSSRIAFSNGDTAFFNLINGTYTLSGGISASIESFQNGWYRCTFVSNVTAGIYVAFSNNGTTGQTVFIWGAQLEAGSYATSYIPTTSASVTRNADNINKTGISSLIGQTEGTLFLDFNYFGNINAPASYEAIPLNVGTGVYSESIYFTVYQSTFYLTIWTGSVNQVTISLGTITKGRYKSAISYANNDVKVYLNGSLAGTDTSVTLPTLSAVFLGTAGTSTAPEGHSTNTVALWKTRLTNTQLAQLTTI
jgi:hypothetical protein